jgi:hypothetical protein
VKLLKVICENEVDAVPEVVKWNSWDAEHLRTVHSAYSQPASLISSPGTGLFIDSIRIPVFGFRLQTMVYTTQWNDSTQVSYSLSPFFLAKNTIEVLPLAPKRTRVRVTYEFSGNALQALLFPLVERLIRRWNRQVWAEDLPLKLRRQKALEYGFEDFRGLPDALSSRVDKSLTYRSHIPVIRTRDIAEGRHPFYLEKGA